MAKVLLTVGFIVILGLAHIQLRLATRGMEIQRSRLQADRTELRNRQSALVTEVRRLSGGEDLLVYARDRLGLVEVPADQIRVLHMPQHIENRYDHDYSKIALARMGDKARPQREDFLDRLLATVLSPEAQAQPASPGY